MLLAYMSCTFPQKVGLGMKKSERADTVRGERKPSGNWWRSVGPVSGWK